jgi:serine/threonine-protein kinase
MELVEGRSLQDELASGMRFGWREAARIGIQITRALKHAHDRGIIHRDLKPANLLIDKLDVVKLTDFGIAKLFGSSSVTVEGGVIGTADYMPPEQAEGKSVTARSDLYSLGSVLYALLTGKPPFAAKTVAEVLHGLRFEKPIAVRRLAPDTPEEFENIVLQLLEKDPTKRIPTAIAVGNRLQAMEHALSLETRLDKQEPLPLDAGPRILSKPPSIAEHIAGQQTAAMPGEIGFANRPGDMATIVTGEGAKPIEPSARTAPQTGLASSGASVLSDAPVISETAKRTHFTTVSEAELRRADASASEEEEGPLQFWTKFIALVLFLVAAAYGLWWTMRPASADTVYARIAAAGESGEGARLAEVEEDVRSFLQRYPDDPRAPDVTNYLSEIDRYRTQRRLELKARRSTDPQSLAPVERAYMEATRLANTEPELALARFRAIVDLFGPASDAESADDRKLSDHCVELARAQIERLEPIVDEVIRREQAAVRQRLEYAEQIADENPSAAQGIWRSVIELYGNKSWAGDFIADAQARLDAQAASTSEDN